MDNPRPHDPEDYGRASDFTDLRLDERFTLVVLALNTLFALPTQDAQVGCFDVDAGAS